MIDLHVQLTYGHLSLLLVAYLATQFIGGLVRAAARDLIAARKRSREESDR